MELVINDGGDGIGGGWFIHIRVWVGGQGWVLSHSFFFNCAFAFWCLTSCYYLIVVFLFVLLSFGVSCPVSFLIE